MEVGIGTSPLYRDHSNGPGHPERPERLLAIEEVLRDHRNRLSLVELPSRPATRRQLERVHGRQYLDILETTREREITVFDADTTATSASYDVALAAAGGAMEAVSAAVSGSMPRSFVFSRPPGHHAEANRAMGFCLLNNAAVAAAYAVAELGLSRVAIVDWDVHHGNGTAHIFDDRPDVMYVSLHQHPHYPGSGRADEVGQGEGTGFTVNVPLPAGCTDADYLCAMQTLVVPVLREYSPELIIVSAGFDAHRNDPLSGMLLSGSGFGAMTTVLLGVANDFASGRIVHLLEGGYDLAGIREGVMAVLGALTESAAGFEDQPDQASSRAGAAIEGARLVLGRYWAVLNERPDDFKC
jgi:acetoin utilization deacetylase AcuC-like enzyme